MYQFLPTHFFLQFVNSQIVFVLFCNDVVNLHDVLAGIFYDMYGCKFLQEYGKKVVCRIKRIVISVVVL